MKTKNCIDCKKLFTPNKFTPSVVRCRPCAIIYKRARSTASSIKWKKANPEKVKELRKKHYSLNKEKENANAIAYTTINKDNINKQRRIRYDKNKSTIYY